MAGLLLFAAGCQPRAKKDPTKPEPDKKPEQGKNIEIATDSSTLEHKNEKGELVLELDSKTSITKIDSKNSTESESALTDVSGSIFGKGELVCTFTSPQGLFDRKTKTLQLKGGVSVYSKKYDLALTSAEIRWTEASDLIEAKGAVWLKGKLFESGPAAKLMAKPDLSRFGTPDRFKP